MAKTPILPDVARALLKSTIISLATVGLISGADADFLIKLIGLRDA